MATGSSGVGAVETARPHDVGDLLAEVRESGYVLIPELVPRDEMLRLKEEVGPLLTHEGRTEFEGYRTRRIYSVIEKTLAVNVLIEHPLILALLDELLMENFLLSQVQVIDVLPGEVAQPLHHDDGFYPFPRPRRPFSAATIWAVDDFTGDNGATRVLPGSHTWGPGTPDADALGGQLVPAEMPAGSVIFFLGTLWHGAGANQTGHSRMAATIQYCEPWARQQENYCLAISRERARQCSERIQSMLGYSLLAPFIGMVDGRHPRRLLD